MKSLLALVVSLSATLAPPAEAQPAGAAKLAAAAEIKAGTCVIPRAADAGTLLEWAGLSGFTVHAQAAGEPKVLELRRAAAEKGVLARSVYVTQGGADRLGLAAGFAELVLVADAVAGDLTPALRDEWTRVLIPGRGRLLLKLGAGVDEKGARARLGAPAEGRVAEVDGAKWFVARRALLEGTDQWTHRNRDASNARVSVDASIKPPFLTQWWGLPLHEGFWGTTIVAGNGRSHTLWMGGWPQQRYALVTRSLGNGAPLWERTFAWDPPRDRLSGGYYPGRSCMVLDGDVLHLMMDAGIEQVNAETGETLGRIAGPKPGGQAKWIAAENGVLVVLSGEPDTYKSTSLQNELLNPHGRTLAAYEMKGGYEQLWMDEEAGDIDMCEIAIRDGRLFYFAEGARAACRDIKTGKVIWENSTPEALAALGPRQPRRPDLLVSVPILTAAPEVLLFSAAWLTNQTALDPADGKVLWSQQAGKSGRVLHSLVLDGEVHLAGSVLDARTGQKLRDERLPASGCGPTKAVPGMFLTTFASCVPIGASEPVRATDVKGPCDAGPVVADGAVLNASGRCRCNLEMQGYRVFKGAGSFDPHAPVEDPARLVAGPAAKDPPSGAADPRDWSAYRHDAGRSGVSPAKVGGAAGVVWRFEPPASGLAAPPPAGQTLKSTYYPEFVPTQAVAADGRVLQGGPDGVVRCLDAATGKAVWEYPVGSKLFAPPAIAGARVYAGAGDGWVYCLRLKDGALAWRFRAAPVERRIGWYGHQTSTWPLAGGVAVHDGTVYAAAGYQDHNGVHVWALDAASGAVKWSSHDAAKDVEQAMAAFGHVAIAAGRLWLCTASVIPGSFDLATGEKRVLPNTQFSGNARRGMEIGAFGGDWVMAGGRRLSHPMRELWREREKNTGISFVRASAKLQAGAQACFGIEAIEECEFLPVADGEIAAVIQSPIPRSGREGKVFAWPAAELLKFCEATVEPKPQFLGSRAPLYLVPLGKASKEAFVPPIPVLWEPAALNANGLVLAADAVVVSHATAGAKEEFPDKWAVSALDRKTGQPVWSVDLPGAPIYEGLSIDRDGRVLVAMMDGGLVAIGK